MAIPLAYNLRNLTVRKTTTLMTALGIALTVSVLVAVLALVNGLQSAFKASGNPLNILVMRKGANAELRGGMNITLRGLTQVGLEIREKTKIATGRWFRAGQREVVVGKSVAKRYPDAELGKKLHFGRGDWEVVGVMDSNSSATNSEIYADFNQMAGDFNRQDGPSSALIRATDSVAAQALINSINDDQRLNSNARTELEYMDSQTNSAAPVQYLGIFIAIIMAVGSSFAAINTMYAAVARRAKEVGTLRVLGFSRGSILTSFFIESLLLSLLGGALGDLLALPLNGVTTAIGNGNFAEMAFGFQVTPQIMLTGVVFAVILGSRSEER